MHLIARTGSSKNVSRRLGLVLLVATASVLAACSGIDGNLLDGDATPDADAATATEGGTDAASPSADAKVDPDAQSPDASSAIDAGDGGEAHDATATDAAATDATATDATATDASAVGDSTILQDANVSADATVGTDAGSDAGAVGDAGSGGHDAALPSCASTPWTSVVVDSPVLTSYDGPAIGASKGTRRIAIADTMSSQLRMASQNGTTWTAEGVDGGSLPMNTSQAIDESGTSHVALFDFQKGQALVEGTPGAFALANLTTVGSTVGTAFFRGTSGGRTIALDSEGTLHLLYLNDGGQLHHAARPKGGTWSNLLLAQNVAEVWANLVTDGTSLHAVYINTYVSQQYLTVMVASKTPNAAWSAKPLASGGTQPSLAVDAQHGLHVSYLAVPQQNLVYAHRPAGGVWQYETVDAPGNVGARSRIAVDTKGAVHIVYDDTLNGLKEAVRTPGGSAWTVTVVDPNGAKGDVLVDADGTTHVAYSNEPEKAVKWASRPPCD